MDGNGPVVVNELAPDEGQAGLIKSRDHIEQAHILRIACLPKMAKVCAILSGNQVLWVSLLGKTSGELYNQITGSSCKR
jgi:hypothetical protein